MGIFVSLVNGRLRPSGASEAGWPPYPLLAKVVPIDGFPRLAIAKRFKL
jgi:hypothetical protein